MNPSSYSPRWTWNRYARTIARAPGSPELERLHRELQDTNPERTPIDPKLEGTLEHLSRYLLARALVQGKRVIDGGCGYGYGSLLFESWGARSVLALDYDRFALDRIPRDRPAIDRLNASLSALPLPARSIDVMITFEVIEHLAEPELFLEEARRVLSPEGILLISTPNRDLVSPGWSLPPNRFHLREWSATEFAAMLRAVFPRVVLRGQIPGKKLIERRESGRKARKLAIQIERAIGLDPRGLIPSGVRSLSHRGKRAGAINEKTAEASPAALPSPSDLESRVRSLVQLGLSAGGPELDGLFRYGPAEDGEQSVAWCSIAGDVESASSAR